MARKQRTAKKRPLAKLRSVDKEIWCAKKTVDLTMPKTIVHLAKFLLSCKEKLQTSENFSYYTPKLSLTVIDGLCTNPEFGLGLPPATCKTVCENQTSWSNVGLDLLFASAGFCQE